MQMKLTNLSLSPSQSQAKPSQAKVWAEVFYIITMCARARARPHAGESLISQLLLNRINPNFQDILGPTQGQSWWRKILPSLSQNLIFFTKGG